MLTTLPVAFSPNNKTKDAQTQEEKFASSTNNSKIEKDVFILLVTQVARKKNRVLPTGVEPMTFWLVVQMLYH